MAERRINEGPNLGTIINEQRDVDSSPATVGVKWQISLKFPRGIPYGPGSDQNPDAPKFTF